MVQSSVDNLGKSSRLSVEIEYEILGKLCPGTHTLEHLSWDRVWNSLIHGLSASFLTPPATINTVKTNKQTNKNKKEKPGGNIFTISPNKI